MVLRIRQGLDSDRESFTPASGELIYTTDQKEVWVGDGTTAGGIAVSGGGGGGGATTLGALNDVVISDPTVGEVLKYDGTNWVNDTDASGGGGLTTEEVEDIVAAMFADGSQTNITITYNDNYPRKLMQCQVYQDRVFRTFTRTGEVIDWRGAYVITDGG